ncbi:MAG: Ig-like domain-containing protein [Pseudomonadota bacterium]
MHKRSPVVSAGRWRLGVMLPAAALALAACGGGVWLGFGDRDDPPDVSLAAPPGAAPGQTVRLAAAASDDFAVDYVAFYRFDDNGNSVYLGRDESAPYDWDAVMPNTSADRVRFLARAVDDVGQWADSETVSVAVLR